MVQPLVTGSMVGGALTLGIPGAVAAATGAAAAVEADEIKPRAVGGGTIKLDIEQAPAVIAALEDAINKVKAIRAESYKERYLEPPGNEPYSQYAVDKINESTQRHDAACDVYLQILMQTVDTLRKSFDAYRNGDLRNAETFSSGSEG